MKIRVVKETKNGYPLFILQKKVFGFWFNAYHVYNHKRIYFKSGISEKEVIHRFLATIKQDFKEIVVKETDVCDLVYDENYKPIIKKVKI